MSDHIRCSCQDHLNHKQDRSCEQEGEFKRLRDSRQHTCQGCGEQKSSRLFLLLRLCAAVHRQRRSRKAEDHEDKFTGEISRRICAEVHCRRISQLSEEDILSAFHDLSRDFHRSSHCGLPERKIEYMVQTKWDERTLDDTEDQSSDISSSGYEPAQCINPVLDYRPDKIHQDSHAHIGDRGNDRHKS